MIPEDKTPIAPPSRRFIAGAVCPRCSAMDTIVVDRDTDLRECVACGFSDPRPKDKAPAPAEPGTRVSRAAARRVETAAEAVRILEPAPKRGK
ncbi:MAG: YheV family putative metal-binding protein [Haliea sp.]|uniref:YheV family putative zinc ribbon protein n=1 Tax=Haliea sp. TaxID=1932666 RepID=UPI0032ED24A6